MFDAFSKLSRRDQIILLVSVPLTIGILVFLLTKFMNTSFRLYDTYPESGLIDDPSYQEYRQGSYTNLPYMIQFPGLPYMVSVGGSELPATQRAAWFQFNDDVWLFAGVASEGEQPGDFILANIPKDVLFADAGSYHEAVSDNGYSNTLFLTYSGGTLIPGNAYYLTYLYEAPDGSRLLIGTVAVKQSVLLECRNLLLKVFSTMGVLTNNGLGPMGEGAVPAAPTAAGTLESPAVAAGDSGRMQDAGVQAPGEGASDITSNAASNGGSGAMSTQGQRQELERLDRTQTQNANRLAHDTPEVLDLETTVEKKMGEAIFILECANTGVDPDTVYLTSPEGEVLQASDINSAGDGRILFSVKDASAGTWKLHIETYVHLGVYTFSVKDRKAYEESTIPYGLREDAAPRGGDY